MPTNSTFVDTPYYVLMGGRQILGPEVSSLPSGKQCVAIFGFSDKESYDKFCEKGQTALLPYPLTKVYLRERVDAPGDSLNLVVVNAVGPQERCLRAGTMEAVLQGQEERTLHVTAAYELTFDPESAGYQVNVNKHLKTGR